MLAAVYNGNPSIQLTQADIPAVGARQALLKVHTSGICGTDLRILKAGHRRIPAGASRILGHELSGEIVAVGKEVTWPRPGLAVGLAPNMGCGHCENCIQGYTQLCADYISFGVVIDGGFAEYMLIPEEAFNQGNICPIPDGVSFEEAALVEPLSCVYHGFMACRPQPGEDVLIVGAGPIGLMFMKVARALGAGKVLISEMIEERIEQARQMGADYTINPAQADLPAAVRDITGGRGADIAIVAAPAAAAQGKAVEALAYHGRVNFFGGLPAGGEITQLNANLVHYRELTITGTTGQTVKEYRKAMDLVASRKVNIRELISGRFALRDVAAAFESAQAKQGLRTLVYPE